MGQLKPGEMMAFLRSQRWCKQYRNLSMGNRLPQDWKQEFNADSFYMDFPDENSTAFGLDLEDKSKSDLTSKTSKTLDTYENFRVKLSDYLTFSGKGQEWYNFMVVFEATCDAAGFDSDLLTLDPAEEADHMDKQEDDPEYDLMVQKLYKILKIVTTKGTAKVKVRKFEQKKDGVLAYAYLRSYYDLDGDKELYGQAKLEDILELKLFYNSIGAFEKYESTFEDLCEKLESCDQGLTESQKHTFFLNGIKDDDYVAVKMLVLN